MTTSAPSTQSKRLRDYAIIPRRPLLTVCGMQESTILVANVGPGAEIQPSISNHTMHLKCNASVGCHTYAPCEWQLINQCTAGSPLAGPDVSRQRPALGYYGGTLVRMCTASILMQCHRRELLKLIDCPPATYLGLRALAPITPMYLFRVKCRCPRWEELFRVRVRRAG
jgi:hypothetical protein